MTSSPEQDDRFMQLLAIARQKPSSERETYLRVACEGDEGLLSAIADELSSEERMGSFMQHPVGLIPGESTPPSPTATRPTGSSRRWTLQVRRGPAISFGQQSCGLVGCRGLVARSLGGRR